MNSVIVVIGYNRVDSLQHCLDSVMKGTFNDDKVDLIVSLDHSDKEDEIETELKKYNWTHGDFNVLKHEERMGLRKHVISCGNLIGDHDFLIMLEDDICVSDCFYLYVSAAVQKYGDNEHVVGISMYSPHMVQQNGRFFTPEYNGSDVYMFQHSQSWGQAWTKRMWNQFHEWFLANPTFEKPFDMPDNSYGWGERSWMKYFMGFICSGDRYLVYPYHAFSTNMNDSGEHQSVANTDYQVPLTRNQTEFKMLDFEQCVKYNGHSERVNDQYFSYSYHNEPVLLDLNGIYSNYANYRYVVSTKKLDYKILKTYGLRRRPQEVNLTEETVGNDIFLYDLSIREKNNYKSNYEQLIRYDVKATSWRRLLFLGVKVGIDETFIHNGKNKRVIDKLRRKNNK